MGELDAAADVVTGALLGRAVEPNAGEGGGHGGHGLCLNCGTALIGPHCHRCGQASHIHRTISGIGHDLLHGVFHFEGKLWRTLPLLTWRPGELTRRYIEGERARFVSPIALFLFSIFTMFAVFSFAGIATPTDLESVKPLSALEKNRAELVERRDKSAALLKERDTDAEDRARYQSRIADAERQIAALDEAKRALQESGIKKDSSSPHTGWHALDHGIEKWRKNPSLMLYKLQSSAYKFSWLLIPLSLPFMWLLFAWRREYKLYDHAIFVTYSIAFMSLLLVTFALIGEIGGPFAWTKFLLLAIVPVHIFRQLKGAYALGWIGALVRTAILLWFILIIATLFALVLLFMGLLG